jgi:hypothetical protein
MSKSDLAFVFSNLKRLRKHIVIIIGLLLIQFFSRNIWKTYYSEFQKPYMLNSGATLCQSNFPILPERLPSECDIVLVKRLDNSIIEETFYTHQGEVRVRIYSQSGIYVNEVSTMLGNIATLILPVIGFIGYMVVVFHKIGRTGAFITTELHKHPNDSFEQLLSLYSLPLFFSSFFFH